MLIELNNWEDVASKEEISEIIKAREWKKRKEKALCKEGTRRAKLSGSLMGFIIDTENSNEVIYIGGFLRRLMNFRGRNLIMERRGAGAPMGNGYGS